MGSSTAAVIWGAACVLYIKLIFVDVSLKHKRCNHTVVLTRLCHARIPVLPYE